ncbi:unnamed protein product, partial [Rotaria sp. Silwood2]
NHSKNVTLTFDDASRHCGEVFHGKHKEKVFVTTYRMIFLNDDQRLKNIDIHLPVKPMFK